jgi:hypothetical protein
VYGIPPGQYRISATRRPAAIMNDMPFFGYHMPSFTFPGVPPDGLFDHVGELARSAESAGFESQPRAIKNS